MKELNNETDKKEAMTGTLELLDDGNDFFESIRGIQQRAKAKGLTEAILNEILNEKP